MESFKKCQLDEKVSETGKDRNKWCYSLARDRWVQTILTHKGAYFNAAASVEDSGILTFPATNAEGTSPQHICFSEEQFYAFLPHFSSLPISIGKFHMPHLRHNP
jgi:hypothetical protein